MGLIYEKGGVNFGLFRRSVVPARRRRILLEGGNLTLRHEGGDNLIVDSGFFVLINLNRELWEMGEQK